MQKGKKLHPLTILFPVAVAALGVYYIIKKSKTPKPKATDFYAKNNNVKDTNVKETPKIVIKGTTQTTSLGDYFKNPYGYGVPKL